MPQCTPRPRVGLPLESPRVMQNAKDKIDQAADKAKDVTEKAGHAVKDGAATVADKAMDVAEKAGHAVKDGASTVADKVKDAGKAVGKKLGA